MISVEEAKSIIKGHVNVLEAVTVAIEQSAGYILAGDVFSGLDIPAFDQSSMDGYALTFGDYQRGKPFGIIGEVAAGSSISFDNPAGKAVRIFTGAPVPPGMDTVVMQEKVKAVNNMLFIEDDLLVKGANVRPKGSEISRGELALSTESILSPAALGFLAGMGIAEVPVIPQPDITIIVTGRELQQPGLALGPGQVYELNSLTLKAALKQLHYTSIQLVRANDDLQEVTRLLEAALQKSHMVLLTGGISVGDYDFVLRATELCGVKKLFHKIKQKPGKPLFFGKTDNKLVFGLPGNPSSVLTCFYEYVTLALEALTLQKSGMGIRQMLLTAPYTKKEGLTHFLKGIYQNDKVTPLNAQESYKLSSFAKANCLIKIDEDATFLKEGDEVEVHVLNT